MTPALTGGHGPKTGAETRVELATPTLTRLQPYITPQKAARILAALRGNVKQSGVMWLLCAGAFPSFTGFAFPTWVNIENVDYF